jgi:MFS family permease
MYRSLALPVYLPSFLMSIGQGIALLIVPLYALDLGGSPASAAVIFACRGLGNMIADLPAGYAAQRFGDAYVMKAGVVLMIIAALGAAMTNSLPQLGVFTAVIGVSMATWLLARLTLISDRVSTEFRGQALSGLAGLQRVGNFLGPILGGYLAYIANYQLAFALIACLAGITLLLVLTYSTDAPSKVERSPGLAGTAERRSSILAGASRRCSENTA